MEDKMHRYCEFRWLAVSEVTYTDTEIRTFSAFQCIECGIIREDVVIIRKDTLAWSKWHGELKDNQN